MTSRIAKTYHCDFVGFFIGCEKKTENPELYRWFELPLDRHACKSCGHQLHTLFDTFGIAHFFNCTEYHQDSSMGIIQLSEDGDR